MTIGEQIIAAYFVKYSSHTSSHEDASGVELSAAMKKLEAVVEAHIEERVRGSLPETNAKSICLVFDQWGDHAQKSGNDKRAQAFFDCATFLRSELARLNPPD